MEYTNGSYLIIGRQPYECLHCHKDIPPQTGHFCRVNEFGEFMTRKDGVKYRNKEFLRYHVDCAEKMYDISNAEKVIIQERKFAVGSPYRPFRTEVTSEKHLRQVFNSLLDRYERNGKLSYIKITQGLLTYPKSNKFYYIGKAGCSDLIVFLPKGRTVFVELKWEKGKYNDNQLKFQEKIKKLGYDYICVRSKLDISEFMKKLNE